MAIEPLHRNRAGMSLAEVMLAVGLLGLILVAVIGLFHSLLSSTSKSGDLTAATVLAQHRLNELVAQQPQNLTTYGLDFPAEVVTKGLYTHDSKTSTDFYTQAEPELLYIDNKVGKAYYLQVTVFWWTADNSKTTATRAGHGKQSVTIGRMVYVPTP
jgi:Tfp pilus assembly protein PilV